MCIRDSVPLFRRVRVDQRVDEQVVFVIWSSSDVAVAGLLLDVEETASDVTPDPLQPAAGGGTCACAAATDRLPAGQQAFQCLDAYEQSGIERDRRIQIAVGGHRAERCDLRGVLQQ